METYWDVLVHELRRLLNQVDQEFLESHPSGETLAQELAWELEFLGLLDENELMVSRDHFLMKILLLETLFKADEVSIEQVLDLLDGLELREEFAEKPWDPLDGLCEEARKLVSAADIPMPNLLDAMKPWAGLKLRVRDPWASGLSADAFFLVLKDLERFVRSLDDTHPGRPDYDGIRFLDPETSPGQAARTSSLLDRLLAGMGLRRVSVPRSHLLSPQEFEPRFRARMRSGGDWLKFDVMGVHGGKLVVCVSGSTEYRGCPPEGVFVNYSALPANRGWELNWTIE